MSTEVFISYRRTDRKLAERLGECLKARGVSYWYDGKIGPGEDWRDEIVENIRLAKVLVILFSEAVNSSTELKKELSVADDTQTIIITVRIEKTTPKGGYEYELSSRNWFDAFDNPHRQLDEVAELIASVLKTPGDLKARFAKSSEELKRRRRRQLFGYYGLLRNNAFLIGLFLAASVIQYFVYDTTQAAIENLVRGGTSPLLAILAVAFVVSFGSPLLLLQAMRQELSGLELLLIPCSLIIVAIFFLLIRNLVSWVREWQTERQA